MSIIIKTPQPDTEERLVLVPLDAVSRTEGGDALLTIRTANARDATPDDLARGGYVRDGDTRAGLREALRARERAELDALAELDEQRARAEKAEGLLIQRETELRLAREDGDERARDLRQAYERAVAAAEKAERERDEALGRAQSETEWRVRAVSERQDAEAERDTLRAELARLTAPGEGEPSFECLRDCWDMAPRADASGSDVFRNGFFALYRLGVANERARQQPAKDLREVSAELEAMRTTHDERDRVYVGAIASDDELVTVYRRAAEPLGDEHGVSLRDLVRRCQARGVLAVAARVRKECLVAQAVGMGADLHVVAHGVAHQVTVAKGRHMQRAYPDAADVPATLARLLGEVEK